MINNLLQKVKQSYRKPPSDSYLRHRDSEDSPETFAMIQKNEQEQSLKALLAQGDAGSTALVNQLPEPWAKQAIQDAGGVMVVPLLNAVTRAIPRDRAALILLLRQTVDDPSISDCIEYIFMDGIDKNARQDVAKALARFGHLNEAVDIIAKKLTTNRDRPMAMMILKQMNNLAAYTAVSGFMATANDAVLRSDVVIFMDLLKAMPSEEIDQAIAQGILHRMFGINSTLFPEMALEGFVHLGAVDQINALYPQLSQQAAETVSQLLPDNFPIPMVEGDADWQRDLALVLKQTTPDVDTSNARATAEAMRAVRSTAQQRLVARGVESVPSLLPYLNAPIVQHTLAEIGADVLPYLDDGIASQRVRYLLN